MVILTDFWGSFEGQIDYMVPVFGGESTVVSQIHSLLLNCVIIQESAWLDSREYVRTCSLSEMSLGTKNLYIYCRGEL